MGHYMSLHFRVPTDQGVTAEMVAPLEGLKKQVWGDGMNTEYVVTLDLDNLPTKLPPFLKDLPVQPYACVKLPGYGTISVEAEIEDYSRGFYEKVRPVLVALGRISKPAR